jgi:SEC-C motif
MSSQTGRNDPCGCGSGQKYKDCCGAPKLEVASVRVKDVKDVELTPGLAEAFTASLDASYLEYFAAACSGMSTKEAERRIAAIPEDRRYLTRVLDSLDNAFADFDTETAKLDLPHNPRASGAYHFCEGLLTHFRDYSLWLTVLAELS